MADQEQTTQVSLDAKGYIDPLQELAKNAEMVQKFLAQLDSVSQHLSSTFSKSEVQTVKGKKALNAFGKQVDATAKNVHQLQQTLGPDFFKNEDQFKRMKEQLKGVLSEQDYDNVVSGLSNVRDLMKDIQTSPEGAQLFRYIATKEDSEAAVRRVTSATKKIRKAFANIGIKDTSDEFEILTKQAQAYAASIQETLGTAGRKGSKRLLGDLAPKLEEDTRKLLQGLEDQAKAAEKVIEKNAREITNKAFTVNFKKFDSEAKRRAQVIANELATELSKVRTQAPKDILKGFVDADIDKAAQVRQEYSKVYRTYEKLTKLQRSSQKEFDRSQKAQAQTTRTGQARKSALDLGIVPDTVKRYDIRTRLTKQARVIAEEYETIAKQAGRSYDTLAQKIRNGNKNVIEEFTDLSDAVRKYDQIMKDADKNTKGVLISWESFERLVLARIITVAFYNMTQAVADMTTATLALSKGVAEVETISQTAGLSTDRWRRSVRALSDEYNFLQEDVVEGAYQAISNQIAAGDEIIDFMGAVGPFARTTKSDLADAVELMSSVLNSFRLEVEQTESVAATMFKTIELGRVRASEMANTFGRIGVIAEQVGLSLEELNAMITTLTISGLKFGRASTLIVNVINKLIKPSDAMQRTIESWGVTSGEAAIEVFGLAGTLDRLAKASNYSLGEIAQDVGRIRATIGFAGLFGDLPRYRKNLEELQSALTDYRKAVDITAQSTGQVLTRQQNKLRNILLEYNRQSLEIIRNVNDAFEAGGTDIANMVEALGSIAILPGTLYGATKFLTNFVNSFTKDSTNLFDVQALQQFLQDLKMLKKQKIAAVDADDVKEAAKLTQEIKAIAGYSESIKETWATLIVHLPKLALIASVISAAIFLWVKRTSQLDQMVIKLSDEFRDQTAELQKQAILTQQSRKETERFLLAYDRSKMEESILAIKKATAGYVAELEKANEKWAEALRLEAEIAATVVGYLKDLRNYREEEYAKTEDPREGLKRQTQLLVAARDEYYRALGSAPEMADEALKRFTSRSSSVRKQYGDFVRDLQKIQELEVRSQQVPVPQLPEYSLSTDYKTYTKTIEQEFLAKARNQNEWNYVKAAFNEWERVKSEQYKILDKWGFVDPSTGFVIDFHPDMLNKIESERQQFEQYMQASVRQIAGARGIALTGNLERDIAQATRDQKSLASRADTLIQKTEEITKAIQESEGYTRADLDAHFGALPENIATALSTHLVDGLANPIIEAIFEGTRATEEMKLKFGEARKDDDKAITKEGADAKFVQTFLSGASGPLRGAVELFAKLEAKADSFFAPSAVLPSAAIKGEKEEISAILAEFISLASIIQPGEPLTKDDLVLIAKAYERGGAFLERASTDQRNVLVPGRERFGTKHFQDDIQKFLAGQQRTIASIYALTQERYSDIGLTIEELSKVNITRQDEAHALAQVQLGAIIKTNDLLSNPNIKPFSDAFFNANEGLIEAIRSERLNVDALNRFFEAGLVTNQVLIESKGNVIVPTELYKASGGTIMAPKGTDTVPAMLTPGEFVVNKNAAKKHRHLLHGINSGYYAEGGPVLTDGNIDYSNSQNWTKRQWLEAQQLLLQDKGKALTRAVTIENRAYKTAYTLDKAGTAADMALIAVGLGPVIAGLKVAGKKIIVKRMASEGAKIIAKETIEKSSKETAKKAAKLVGTHIDDSSLLGKLRGFGKGGPQRDKALQLAKELDPFTQGKKISDLAAKIEKASLSRPKIQAILNSSIPYGNIAKPLGREALKVGHKQTDAFVQQHLDTFETLKATLEKWGTATTNQPLKVAKKALDDQSKKNGIMSDLSQKSYIIKQIRSLIGLGNVTPDSRQRSHIINQIRSLGGIGSFNDIDAFAGDITQKIKEAKYQQELQKYGVGRAKINGKDVRGDLLTKRKKRGYKEFLDQQDALYSTTWAPALNKPFNSGYVADGINVWDGYQWMPDTAWMEVYNKSFPELRDLVTKNRAAQQVREVKAQRAKTVQEGSFDNIAATLGTQSGLADQSNSYAWLDEKGNKFIFDGSVWHTPDNYVKMYGSLEKPIENRKKWSAYTAENAKREYANNQVMYFDGHRWMSKEEYENWYERDYVTGKTAKKFAAGGWVPGSGSSDSIPALLTPGEFVVKASAAKQFGAMLTQMNTFTGAARPTLHAGRQAYAQGGPVTNNYSNKVDVTLVSSGHAEIDGRRIINVINRDQFNGTARIRS